MTHIHGSLAIVVLLTVATLGAGSLGALATLGAADTRAATTDPGTDAPDLTAGFGAPTRLNAPGTYGYEPTIDVAPDGRLYVTAHRGSVATEGSSLSSFVWTSADGEAWTPLAAPAPLRDVLYAFEGDLDIDGAGHIYFADTFGPELWLSRSSDGTTWDRTTPLVTSATFNDRPWLAAQGDGVLHLTTQEPLARPALGALLAGGETPSSTVFYYRSENGGLTWTNGHALPGALFCNVAGSPADVDDVAIVCATGSPSAPREVVHRSRDGGRSWASETVFQHSGRSAATSFVSISFDGVGNLFAAFIDGTSTGDRLHIAKDVGTGWIVEDVTPFHGTIRKAWTTAAGEGRVAVAFYATSDAPATATSAWRVHVVSADDAILAGPAWVEAVVDPVPVTTRAVPPQDFLQAAISPDARLFVAYARDAPLDAAHMLPPDFDADIMVASRP